MSEKKRLRVPPLPVPIHVVLVEPEIPPNTGNIARLCAATRSPLHLVGKLGFRIDDHAVRRAGLDYWHLVDVRQHLDLPHFVRAWKKEVDDGSLHLFDVSATKSYIDAGFRPGDALIFGKETVGLSREILEAHPDRIVAIPMSGPVRSLNLANAVSIALFEALRQSGGLARAALV